MPAGYLHRRCVERACAAAGVTPAERDVMVLGSQGPDPLFLLGIFPLRPSSRPLRLGNLVHESRTGAFLRALCRRAKEGGAVQRAYALGFLTHYALDSTVHPYVYAHSYTKDGRYSSALHMTLEKSWDTLYYRRDGNPKGTTASMPGAAETKGNWLAIAALLAGALDEVFPEERVTDELIMTALAGTERANRLTHSPHGVKYGIVWALERIVGKAGYLTGQMTPVRPMKGDITNEAHTPWRSPFEPERERTEGLEELFETAVRRAGELLIAASKYFDGEIDENALAAIIGNVGYDSGLESNP